MGRLLLLLIGAIGLFLLSLQLETEAGAEGAKVPTLAELDGSYTYAGDRSKDESAIEAKSDTATADMGRMVLKRARSRLASSTRIAESLVITRKDGKVSFQSDDYVVTVPEDGSSASVQTPLGETADASFDAKTATLQQTVAKTGGKKTNIFQFDENGRLVMQVRVTNPKLAGPVAFSVLYARKAEAH